MKKLYIVFSILIFALCNIFAESKVMPVMKVLENITHLKTDAKADVRITQQKAEQGTKVIGMTYYRRDSDNSFLIAMTSPENERGNGYLRVGDNFWMYRKNTRTFQHINRDESIAGTDAKGDDFEEWKLTERYEPATDKDGKEIFSEDMLGKVPVYRFELKAKVRDVDYPKKIYWTRRDNNLLLKEESYSLSGSFMQTAYYLKYTMIDGRYIPIKQMFIDEFEKGNKTIVDISNISTGKLEDKLFTKAYLENLSK